MDMKQKPYLLTGGLVPLLRNRHGLNIGEDIAGSIRDIEIAFFSEMSRLLDGRVDGGSNGDSFLWQVKFISDREIEESLRGKILQRDSRIPLISFDDVYCTDLADHTYHVTRLVDPSDLKKEAVLGARLRAPSLDEQVRDIAKKFGRQVDIMDIGVFEGKTLVDEISGRFRRQGIDVKNIYVMFAAQEGVDRINGGGSKLNYVSLMDWVDWIEMRDCLGFDGRKVDMKIPHSEIPINRFVKYTSNPGKWASIPKELERDFHDIYHAYFDVVRGAVLKAGYDIRLISLAENPLVHDLRISRIN